MAFESSVLYSNLADKIPACSAIQGHVNWIDKNFNDPIAFCDTWLRELVAW